LLGADPSVGDLAVVIAERAAGNPFSGQPAEGKVLYGHEIEILFRTALVEVGLEPPLSSEAAGWDAGAMDCGLHDRRYGPARRRRSTPSESVD
jgi:hypothetical protein